MAELIKEYSHKYFLTAGLSNAQREAPLHLLVNNIIEVATEHANIWGVGYSTLVKEHQGWVLSRLVVEMQRFPAINETYTLTTWIEDYNRHFSQRNFRFADQQGNVIGYARTIWVVIDSITRESVDISKFSYMKEVVSCNECPIDKPSKLMPVAEGNANEYQFDYTDIDFNRHVNTLRYVQLITNQIPLERYDEQYINRFEIAFLKECTYGQIVDIASKEAQSNDVHLEIADVQSKKPHCRARLVLKQRNSQK